MFALEVYNMVALLLQTISKRWYPSSRVDNVYEPAAFRGEEKWSAISRAE